MTNLQSHVISLHLDGASVYEISDKTGLQPGSISSTLREAKRQGIQGFRPVVSISHCPFSSSCRDCVFERCKLDEFLKVVVT